MNFFVKYFVLAFCIAVLDGVKYRCDYRYTQHGWFKYHEMPATWNNARLQCHLEGAILASPTTNEVKSIMLESFCKPEIFTGISDSYSKGLYYSMDGIPLSQIPHEWSKFEPDNKNDSENCIALDTEGNLSDVSCDITRPYICYRSYYNVDSNICATSDPEYHFDNETNKCYKLHRTAAIFETAKLQCFAEGGHLAVIRSKEEAGFLKKMFDKYLVTITAAYNTDYALVGFQWDNFTGWTTIHGQSIQDAGYATFSKGEPSGGEFCGSIYRYDALLNDIICDKKFAFFCEKYPYFPAICNTDTNQNRAYDTPLCDNDVQGEGKQTESNKTDWMELNGNHVR